MTRSQVILIISFLFFGNSAYGKAVAVTTNKAGTINYSDEINAAARNGKPAVKLYKRSRKTPAVKNYSHSKTTYWNSKTKSMPSNATSK